MRGGGAKDIENNKNRGQQDQNSLRNWYKILPKLSKDISVKKIY